ncbi:hypothetical protein LWC35_13145 [Pseudonocardia kujensis]|nr:hypothetical protein [Pseudonocardia kujensis]MCE0763848.1 hypothetical protein [Pseudonocardia kujensis]
MPSHWQIPELHGNAGNVDRSVRVKTETLVPGVKKSLSARPDGRSSDFIAPSTANGCAMGSQSGMRNVRYRNVPKREGVQAVTDLVARRAPWLRVRYAF